MMRFFTLGQKCTYLPASSILGVNCGVGGSLIKKQAVRKFDVHDFFAFDYVPIYQ
jgi:hypothetical protein